MKVATVVHQQVSQIKWHVLASLALIMALPLEEATVNLLEGDGFNALITILPSVMLGPLLAGLIACANVQGDLDDKRHAFWRSKPIGVKRFIAVKYITGLVLALVIQICPMVFAGVTSVLYPAKLDDMRDMPATILLFPILFSGVTYSLCFGCNVVIRKTARSWLIGMAAACLLLFVPFILPLGYKDFVSDVFLWMSGASVAIMLVSAAAAFALALLAGQFDWRVRTSFKGFLWTGAALVLGLMLFVSGQIANIKVLAEKDLTSVNYSPRLERIGDDLFLAGRGYLLAHGDKIILEQVLEENAPKPVHWLPVDHEMPDGLRLTVRPSWPQAYARQLAGGTYSFAAYAYYTESQEPTSRGETETACVVQRLCLTCLKLGDEAWSPVLEVDLSDCIDDPTARQEICLKSIDDQVAVLINKSCLLIDFAQPNVPKVIEKRIDALKLPVSYGSRRPGELCITLIPLESLEMAQRIKISIDRHRYTWNAVGASTIYYRDDMFESSSVDISDDNISFYDVSLKEIVRYDVKRWDREKVYFERTARRPFTFLEDFTGRYSRDWLVKNGQLYVREESGVMVFDIRGRNRIRKLGHFARMNVRIEDMEVLDDGDMLLSLVTHRAGRHMASVCLLKNPG